MNSRLISFQLAAVLLVAVVVQLLLIPAAAQSQSVSPMAEEVLEAAESVFKFMKARDYPAIWHGLTMETKNEIVASIRKAAKKAGKEYTLEQLAQDFASGGTQSKVYWDACLRLFCEKGFSA